MPNDDHRIHIAANDPAFPAKREAAFALMTAAIDAIATGYARRGTTWSRSSARGRTIINLHRNQYGWHATITLRFLLPDGTAAQHGIWADTDEVTLGQFHHLAEGDSKDVGQIAYLDVANDPSHLDLPMQVLHTQALPWLEAHHDEP
jgi:hypothetical protein